MPGPGDQEVEDHRAGHGEQPDRAERHPPSPQLGDPSGEDAAAHAADAVARHEQADRGHQCLRPDLLGQVGHRGGRQPRQCRTLHRAQRDQPADRRGEGDEHPDHHGDRQGGRHHLAPPEALRESAQRQDAEGQRTGRRRHRPARLAGRRAEGRGHGGQQGLGGVQEGEGRDPRGEEREAHPAVAGAAGRQAVRDGGRGGGGRNGGVQHDGGRPGTGRRHTANVDRPVSCVQCMKPS